MNSRLSAGVSASHDSGAFTDLNRLSQLKNGKDRDSEGNIHKVAQEFESLFVNEMFKAMRKAGDVLGDENFMNSAESKTYRDMYDQQLAVTMSKENGVGLASVLERQLSKSLHPGAARANPFAQVASGVLPTSGVAAASAAPSGARDDSALLNQRRISLPPRLADRLLAGIVPPAGAAPAQNDWLAAKSYAAPADKALTVAGGDAISGRRLAQPPLAPGKAAFKSPEEFVATMLPMAQAAAEKIGVDPRYLVAQAALETGWGKSIIRQQDGTSSHNLFGIKAADWQGDSARVLTTEYVNGQPTKESASFRAYGSFEQSFNDYVSFLQNNERYDSALDSAANPKTFVRELQRAGYATDPQYANKVAQIAKQMQTYQAVASVDVETSKG
ncbi:MAG: flagellar assembly peptidoglycan hydrolase FlgJ [Pseudomonadaceae bacterium]|jgi:flagellar protein FlgJ|nr:flagellar assembly peptidoglycan hydrolase FlgJ [Pseudomonadaceae bacterium]